MSVTLTPADLLALGYDPVASAKAGRAVRLADVPKYKPKRTPNPWAPYRSKWELQYAAYLDELQMLDIITAWAYEPDVIVCAGGTRYTPDFLVTYSPDRQEYHEVKGYFRPQDRVRVREARPASAHPIVLVSRAKGVWTYARVP